MAGVVYRKMGWRRSDPGIHEGMTGSLDILNGIIKKQRWKNDGKMRGTAGWVVDTESSNAVPMNLRNTTSDPTLLMTWKKAFACRNFVFHRRCLRRIGRCLQRMGQQRDVVT